MPEDMMDIYTCDNWDPIRGACGKCNTGDDTCSVGNEIWYDDILISILKQILIRKVKQNE